LIAHLLKEFNGQSAGQPFQMAISKARSDAVWEYSAKYRKYLITVGHRLTPPR
jgi:hypothetical protein